MLQQDVLNLNTFEFHPSSNCVCLKQNSINWIRMMAGRTATKIFTLFEKYLIQRRLSSNFQVAVAAFCNRVTSICNPPCRRMPSYTVSFCVERSPCRCLVWFVRRSPAIDDWSVIIALLILPHIACTCTATLQKSVM